jgi:predicted dehydrogenase
MEASAKKHKLVTQMGNQIQAHHVYRNGVQLIRDGAIGKVREVHSWQAGDMRWLLTDKMPTSGDPVPATLNWDLWLGVAPERVYKKDLYHPQNWRGWQDFGTGQLGDFGCHIFDPVFMALELTSPTAIEADAPPINKYTWTPRSKVEYQFPGTPRTVEDTVTVTWYDGLGHKPDAAKLGLPKKQELPHAGSIFVGEKGSMLLPHWADPQLFPEEKFADYNMPKLEDLNHYTSWAHACLGDGTANSNFAYAGPLAEAVMLGAIAIRFPKEQLLWDSGTAQFTHHADANSHLTKEYRHGWQLPTA